jgi:hypothetical protein
MEEDKFECDECEAEYKVSHEHINEVQFCPFCSTPITPEDDSDDTDPDWDFEHE